MEQTFESILQQLLEEYEKDPSRNVDEMLAEKMKELGVSEACAEEAKETSALIDKFAEKAESLQAAKAEGMSRTKWLMQQVDGGLNGIADEVKVEVLNAVSAKMDEHRTELYNQ